MTYDEEAYQSVLEQIRRANAWLSAWQRPEGPLIEEENVRYPTLRPINMDNIRLRRANDRS